MESVMLSSGVRISRLIHGMWRLMDWPLSVKERAELLESTVDLGITTFDHADIYGDYECESAFGETMALSTINREQVQYVGKCGIKLISSKWPKTSVKHYDYSESHIRSSVERSLKNLRTDFLDLLLLHRPSPYLNAEEVAAIIEKLKSEGKIKGFGVSNFLPSQMALLQQYLKEDILVNQVELSVMQTKHFTDGTLDYLQQHKLSPMAWSPLGGGRVFKAEFEQAAGVLQALEKVGENYGEDRLDVLMIAWLLAHPAGICPILGTGKPERLRDAVDALKINLSTQDWFRVYEASIGESVP